ncbi:MAG: hypothetical protein D6820_18220 [Lentisphaerae bacterium]|nr:MAG: hypothetical protein D6820_18220 [Lentisphaerota bacterium]
MMKKQKQMLITVITLIACSLFSQSTAEDCQKILEKRLDESTQQLLYIQQHSRDFLNSSAKVYGEMDRLAIQRRLMGRLLQANDRVRHHLQALQIYGEIRREIVRNSADLLRVRHSIEQLRRNIRELQKQTQSGDYIAIRQ